MIIVLASQFHVYSPWVKAHLALCLNSVLNLKALVDTFNQEKALVGAFSVIVCSTNLQLIPPPFEGEPDPGGADALRAGGQRQRTLGLAPAVVDHQPVVHLDTWRVYQLWHVSHVSPASRTPGLKRTPAVTRVNWKLSCQTCKVSSDLRGFVVDQFICYDWVLPLSGPATIKVLSIKKFLALGDRYFYPPPCYRSSRTRRQKSLERMQEMRWWWTRMWSRWHPTEI